MSHFFCKSGNGLSDGINGIGGQGAREIRQMNTRLVRGHHIAQIVRGTVQQEVTHLLSGGFVILTPHHECIGLQPSLKDHATQRMNDASVGILLLELKGGDARELLIQFGLKGGLNLLRLRMEVIRLNAHHDRCVGISLVS